MTMLRTLAIFLLSALLFVTALPAQAAKSAKSDLHPDFVKARSACEKQFAAKGAPRTWRDRWDPVILRLERFAEKYPQRPEAAEALLLAARSRHEVYVISKLESDGRAALRAAVRIFDLYPKSRQAPDGLILAARLAEKVKDPAGAYPLYRCLLDRYPQSRYAAEAKKAGQRLAAFAAAAETKSNPQKPPRIADSPSVPPAAEPATLNGIRSWSNPGYTRIVLDLSQARPYTTRLLPAEPAARLPARIVVEIDAATALAGLPEASPVNDALVRQVRATRLEKERMRIVLDLAAEAGYRIFSLPEPYRIVIDLTRGAPTPVAVAAPVAPVAKTPPADAIAAIVAAAPKESASAQLAPQPPVGTIRKIVIDAGHGGRDSGAVGPSGLFEKDVVLSMARLLAEEVRELLGWEVVLTRSDDTFIPLEERTAIANKIGADLFVSVHANASPNAAARGIETYYLNYSKNEKAAAVAARENGTSLQQVGDLEQILFDLMAHAKIQESSRLASDIQTSMISSVGQKYSDVRDLGVKEGPFYVLLGANMPSVLVETAFISNSAEETRLATRQYQKDAARAIVSGLRAYAANPSLMARQ